MKSEQSVYNKIQILNVTKMFSRDIDMIKKVKWFGHVPCHFLVLDGTEEREYYHMKM